MNQTITKFFNILPKKIKLPLSPLLEYLGKELVDVLDSIVKIGDLIKG
jgi:hypothetical protein